MLAPNAQSVNPLEYEEVKFYRKRRRYTVPKYRTVSLEGKYHDSDYTWGESKDFFTLLLGLSAKAQQCFLELHKNYDEDTGISYIETKNKTATQRSAFSAGFRELYHKGLAKRVKKQHYMLNPEYYFYSYSFDRCIKNYRSLP